MANQIQKVMYEGYLSAQPEMRYTPTGVGVTNFKMGSHRSYTTKDGRKVDETTWLKVTCWGKLGEIVAQYCDKGSWVIVEGILRVNEYGSPSVFTLASGEPAASFEVTASSVRILKGKDNVAMDVNEDEEIVEDDIPF